MEIDINELNDIKLRAKAYDLIAIIEQATEELKKCNKAIKEAELAVKTNLPRDSSPAEN